MLAFLLTACSASEVRAPSFAGGSADPFEHFMQVCVGPAPAEPGEIDASTGWIEQPARALPPPDAVTTHLLYRNWRQGEGERPNVAWIAEWATHAPDANYLSYSCDVTFNGGSFEELDARLRAAGFRYQRVEGAGERLQGTPHSQVSQWSGRSTLATYVHDTSRCEVRLDHGERDPIGAPCTDCRQNILMCHINSRDLPPAERAAWYRRRNLQE